MASAFTRLPRLPRTGHSCVCHRTNGLAAQDGLTSRHPHVFDQSDHYFANFRGARHDHGACFHSAFLEWATYLRGMPRGETQTYVEAAMLFGALVQSAHQESGCPCVRLNTARLVSWMRNGCCSVHSPGARHLLNSVRTHLAAAFKRVPPPCGWHFRLRRRDANPCERSDMRAQRGSTSVRRCRQPRR